MRRHVHHYTGCSDDARSHTFFNGLINGVTHAIVIGRDDNSLVHKTQPFHLESKFLIQGMRIERLESSEPTTVPINQQALTLAWVERVLRPEPKCRGCLPAHDSAANSGGAALN
jgi:hypothetical protein